MRFIYDNYAWVTSYLPYNCFAQNDGVRVNLKQGGLKHEAQQKRECDMKCKVRALMLMLLMCWASQSSAQPSRAIVKPEMGLCVVVLKDLIGMKDWDERELNVALAFDAFAYRFWETNTSAPKNIKLVKQPNHGRLKSYLDNAGGTHFLYLPNPRYLGNDKLSFKVNVDGKTFSMVYSIKIVDSDKYGNLESTDKLCPNYGWKISQSATPDGTSTSNL